MKLIDIAICTDNKDPRGLGRIRFKRYSTNPGTIETAMDYTNWGDKDLFTATPFLPLNINFVPEIGQAVKIINYNDEKDFANSEYISGPFTTIHDFNGQTHTAQVEFTTYGSVVKHGEPVVEENGEMKNPKAKGSIAKYTDYAIYGKYGSDVVFTENGLQLRGGKLISKEGSTSKQRITLASQPLMADKSSVLYLKKFPQKQEYIKSTSKSKVLEVRDLKAIIEYDVLDFSGDDSSVDFYVYLINGFSEKDKKTYGDIYKTNNPELFSVQLLTGYTQLITGVEFTGHTFSLDVSGINDTSATIRNALKKIHTSDNLSTFSSILPHKNEDLHPFYFRPTEECRTRVLSNNDEFQNRIKIFNKISLALNVGPEHGLVYSHSSFNAPEKEVPKTEMILTETQGNLEQSFSALKSDKIYLLSTDVTNTKTPIDFFNLNKYELTQENYLKDIEPNTFSTVRGENLLNLIRSLVELLNGHHHNLVGPLVQSDPNYIKFMELYNSVEEDILNKSIRIN